MEDTNKISWRFNHRTALAIQAFHQYFHQTLFHGHLGLSIFSIRLNNSRLNSFLRWKTSLEFSILISDKGLKLEKRAYLQIHKVFCPLLQSRLPPPLFDFQSNELTEGSDEKAWIKVIDIGQG